MNNEYYIFIFNSLIRSLDLLRLFALKLPFQSFIKNELNLIKQNIKYFNHKKHNSIYL